MNTIQEIYLFNRFSLTFYKLVVKNYSSKSKWIGSILLIASVTFFLVGFISHIKDPNKLNFYIFSILSLLIASFLIIKGRKINYKIIETEYNKKYQLNLKDNYWNHETIEELRIKKITEKYEKLLRKEEKLELLINHFEKEAQRQEIKVKVSNSAYFIIILVVISAVLGKFMDNIKIELIEKYLDYVIFFGISFIVILVMLYYYIKIPLNNLLNIKSNRYWIIATRLKNIKLNLEQNIKSQSN